MVRVILITTLLCSEAISVLAQSPIADFSVQSDGCSQQRINIHNLSVNADEYWWDFCPEDFYTLKSSLEMAILPTFGEGYGYKLIRSEGLWYGFATSRLNNKIFRLDFGNSPTNAPSVKDLGNPGGLLHLPEGLDFFEANGNWYAFIGSLDFSDPSSGIIRLDFGSSLLNSPSAQNLGNFGYYTRFRDLKVLQQNSNLILILVDYNGNSIKRVNYGNSFDNAITNADIFDSGPINGADLPFGLDIIQNNSNWIMLLTSLNNSAILQLNFGSDIFSVPVTEGNYTFAGVNRPYKVKATLEANNYFIAVSNESTPIDIINFNDLTTAKPPVELGPTNTPMLGIEIFRWMGASYVQGMNVTDNIFKALKFESSCDASFSFSTSTQPTGLIYSLAGTKEIELTAINNLSNLKVTKMLPLSISSDTSPDVDFTSQNVCIKNYVNFSSSNVSGNISTFNWDFGDSTTSNAANPNHIYLNASTYTVNLTVTASNGCQNSAQQTLQVFNIPQANFNLPSASPFCTNQNYVFANTSSFDSDSNPTWQWSVNGTSVSSALDLNYLFTSTSAQTISLVASISGCSTQSTQNINSLTAGPLVGFGSPSTACVGSAVSFTNTTTGTTTGLMWNFGDGNTSSQPNSVTNSFSSTGIFDVTLTASNAAGCINSYSKNISIYSNPQPDFDIELPPLSCANSLSQFDNKTPSLFDSNISSWSWSYGDGNSCNSCSKNPAHTYALATDYSVTLQATTNFGCSNSKQKTITIYPSPQAGFTNAPACVAQSTQFTDASTGSISFYQWSIQNKIFQGATPINPTYIFNSSNSYPVTLTVTGANGCLSQITKTIDVPVLPTVDFSVQAPCTGHPTFFQELYPGGADPAIAWNWNFGVSGDTGAIVSYLFPSENGYTVTMSTKRKSGCVYSTSKNISISTGPVANFTPSEYAGAAPLSVTFENNSTADTYFWQFGDANNTTSTDTSPTFIYTTLGSYKVFLTASNSLGCSDTLSVEIDVVVPYIDLVMNNFSLSADPNSNSSKAVVTILNAGNIPLLDPEVQIDLGGSALINEKISGMIRPGKSLAQTLGLQIVPQSLSYICAIVEAADDADTSNNKQCVSLSNDDVVMQPYPNPATSGAINFDWISVAQENIQIIIYKSNGEIAFQQNLDSMPSGLGQLSINTSNFSNGLYLIQFVGSTKKTYRFMIAN